MSSYYERNRGYILMMRGARYYYDPERYKRQYYQNHEKELAKARQYYHDYRDIILVKKQIYYEEKLKNNLEHKRKQREYYKVYSRKKKLKQKREKELQGYMTFD